MKWDMRGGSSSLCLRASLLLLLNSTAHAAFLWRQTAQAAVSIGQDPLSEKDYALARGHEQAQIAQGASELAKVSEQAITDKRQEYSSVLAEEAAEDMSRKAVSDMEVKSILDQIVKFNEDAQAHAAHVSSLLGPSVARHIRDAAAKAAEEEVEKEVMEEAATAASNASVKVETPAAHASRAAAAAAAAAEPYHLGLLRAQYGAKDSYEKARSAYTAAGQLATEARHLAYQAQDMQEEGKGLQAQLTMTQAHDTLYRAQTMQQWVQKLYKRASDQQAFTGWYQQSMFAAARHAAATMSRTPPDAVFPPPPPKP
mmetsp:Transcript_25467/g.58713  ORF Transcript_25467/g.58713 Transcript_25467/m.58713 type:complete len:313 (-) Transcript_25467:7-945(-)